MEFLCHKPVYFHLVGTLAQHGIGHPYTRQQNNHSQSVDPPAHPARTVGVDSGVRLIVHQLDADKRCQSYIDRVYDEQIEGAEKILGLGCGEAIAYGAERRHQGSGDGNTRQHISLAFRPHGKYSGGSAEKADQNVVDCRRRARQQFAVPLADGRDKEIYGRGQYADQSGYSQIAQRPLDKFEITDSDPEADSDDRAHERRNEHGAYNDGDRVGVKSERRYEDCRYQHQCVAAAERHTLPDSGFGLGLRHEETVKREI